MSDLINLKPIGRVRNDYLNPSEERLSVENSLIEIFPEYTDGLLRLSEHSHFWVLGWFHQAQRNILQVVPRINKGLPKYGVFGLRAFNRPNPIGLSVVKLERIQGNLLTVSDLDFIDGTPVLDIKPYYDQDIIFSAAVPNLKPADPQMRAEMMLKQAVNHHQEKCASLMIAVKMALLAEKELGLLTSRDISIHVHGSRCLGDTLQGLTRAKLANSPRFFFQENLDQVKSIWEKGNRVITIILKSSVNLSEVQKLPEDYLFEIVSSYQ